MATFGTFYLNGNNLLNATSVFTDAALTTLAADNYYSDGTNVRRQVGGTLQAVEQCPSCNIPCGGGLSFDGGQGIYRVSVDLGTTLGGVKIQFDVINVPDGIKCSWNGNNFTEMSTVTFGYVNTVLNNNVPFFIGDVGSACTGAGFPVAAPDPAMNVTNSPTFTYDAGGFWVPGALESYTIPYSQTNTFAGAPGNAIMNIPKSTASQVLDIEVLGPCSGTAWTLNVSCPATLPSVTYTGYSAVSSVAACASGAGGTIYTQPVNGSSGVPALADWAFVDDIGVTAATVGWYKWNDGGVNKYFYVDANGTITISGTC